MTLRELDTEAGRRTWQKRLAALVGGAPLAWYLGGVVGLWLLAIAAAAFIGWRLDAGQTSGLWSTLVVVILFAGVAGQFAVAMVNWVCTMIVQPKALPRLDFSAGIPDVYRTLVAVPVVLADERTLRKHVEQLEWRFLANRDENLFFALLTDFADAPRETMPGDRRLLARAQQEIRRLNERYCRGRDPQAGHASMVPAPQFYLLHRPRKWNAQEGVWMAEERKRGKLAALNRLVLCADHSAFSATVGDLDQLGSVRYVITLDADTRLPRDAARDLIARMAHPLNRPHIDPRTRRVVNGYAILQPRVGATVGDAGRSRFSSLSACDPGIDPYTRQTSDVYQDLFGEGSFIGKGIYDVRAFAAALEGRLPDNRVLSHDLIEGCFARSGVVSDVELFEGLPARFLAEMGRRHRWIRGDWQIAAWLFTRVPAAHGSVRNPLDALARWKIFDNLRRSLVPPMLLGFLLAAWTLLPHLAGYCTLLALLLASGQPVAGCMYTFLRNPPEKPAWLHLRDQGGRLLKVIACEAFSWCVLPYVAYRHADAIVRTLYRLRISHRGLLEWMTASEAEARCPDSCRQYFAAMWPCFAIGTATAVVLAAVSPHVLLWCVPLLAAWLAGPLLAWWTSRPCDAADASPANVPLRQVRRWARQTWHYFECFAGAEENWLPPDNVQSHSPLVVASRTSPTNIGMGLLSALAAYDFGYLSATNLIKRTRRALATVGRLERWRGHLYNWYDTRTLRPLEPRYVSSVDSGNLWGALTVLAAGMDELRDRAVVPSCFLEGLQDTLEVIAAMRARDCPSPAPDNPFDDYLRQLRQQCSGRSPRSARRAMKLLGKIHALAAMLSAAACGDLSALQPWTEALLQQVAAAQREIRRGAFWLCMGSRGRRRLTAMADATATPAARAALKELFEELSKRLDRLDAGCTLASLPRAAQTVADMISRTSRAIAEDGADCDNAESRAALLALRKAAEHAAQAASDQVLEIARLSALCRRFCRMDFRSLFHPKRKLLSIGFQVTANRRDDCYYDLLASEARLTSFLAISHGQLPPEHWFVLGRRMTLTEGKPVLLSWSGSMFEYLMPALLMPSFPGTLLDASCAGAVRRQMRYAQRHGLPWGISESCYNRTDENEVYQYCAHGAPGLGLNPDTGQGIVVAPYASALAMMVAPRDAWQNLARLEREGYLSPHGFYDAIDFTPRSPGASPEPAACRTVMAHHSGMTLVALDNVLLGRLMPQRFLRTPACAAHDLLLQERVPQGIRPIPPEALRKL